MYLFFFFAGACTGSFFYTLFLRYTSKESTTLLSILTRRSSCPDCNKKISTFFLIPVLGYFFSACKCRNCGKKISALYPIAEVMSGTLLCLIFYYNKSFQESIFLFLIIETAIIIALTDIFTMKIPHFQIFLLFLFSLYPISTTNILSNHIFGALFLGGLFLFIILLFPGGMGGGDLKYATIIGLLLGLEFSIIALEVSLVSGALIGSIYGLISGKGLRIKIPFGPFLTIGLLTSLLYGKQILLIYYSFF